jgi:hypothetical protein
MTPVLQSRFYVELLSTPVEERPGSRSGVTVSDGLRRRVQPGGPSCSSVIWGGRGALPGLWNKTNTTRPRWPA